MRAASWFVAWVVVFVVATASALAQRAPDRYRGPIIDVHLHGYDPEARFDADLKNPVTGKKTTLADGREHMRATLAALERHHIVLGIVSAAGDSAASATRGWTAAAPGIIRAATDFAETPSGPGAKVEDLRRAMRAHEYMVFAEIGAQYVGLSLSDPRFEPQLALAEELDVPVGVHTGISFPGISFDPCCKAFRTVYGNPQTVEEALNRHPKLRLWLMHAGWPWTQETIAMMGVYPDLYADIAVIDWIIPRAAFLAHLRALVDAGLADRLMFGSDQMRWPEAIGMAIEGVESATFLTAAQKRAIFCDNAARFFRLDGAANPCRGRRPR